MELLPRGGTLADLCTGSGAVALSVADERPDARVLASELSPAAARWAAGNQRSLGLPVEIYVGDLFEPFPAELRGAFDVVVSNPPYVDEAERALLPRDVVDHEPEGALFAPSSGTSVIERIGWGAREWLRPGGWLVLEIGETQGAAVRRLLTDAGYDEARVAPDLTGRDRIAEGRWT